jgi:hypothetical protein
MKKNSTNYFGKFIIFLISIHYALSCSCLPTNTTLTELSKSTSVFSGKVYQINISSTEVQVYFCISRIWKGIVGTRYLVRTNPDAGLCGFKFEFGKEYLVFTDSINTKLWASICSRTKLISDASDDLKDLGNPLVQYYSNC